MKNNISKLAIYFFLVSACFNEALSQEKIIYSSTHTYLLGRASDPIDTKFSPNWNMVDKLNFLDITPPPRTSFPKLSLAPNSNTDQWKTLTIIFIKGFLLEPHNYGDYITKDEDILPFLISYGILGNGNYTGPYLNRHKDRIDSLFTFFTINKNAVDLLGYLKPVATAAINCMYNSTKSSYKAILVETEKYIKTLSVDSVYYKELEYCKNKKDFSYKDSNGVIDPYRKIKTFVFRRYTDYKSKTWNKLQIDEFEKKYGFRPKPNWGMNIQYLENYCKIIETWF